MYDGQTEHIESTQVTHIVGFWSVDLFERLQIVQDDFHGQLRLAHVDDFHRCSMMSTSRVARLDALTKEVFHTLKDQRGMINRVNLNA